MKTLFHTGGSVLLDDETAAAVLRYSLALAQRSEMGSVTLDDLRSPEAPSRVQLIIGLGVPLATRSIGGAPGTPDGAERSEGIDARTRLLTAPRAVVAMDDQDFGGEAARELELSFELF